MDPELRCIRHRSPIEGAHTAFQAVVALEKARRALSFASDSVKPQRLAALKHLWYTLFVKLWCVVPFFSDLVRPGDLNCFANADLSDRFLVTFYGAEFFAAGFFVTNGFMVGLAHFIGKAFMAFIAFIGASSPETPPGD